MNDISIIIPTFNNSEGLGRALRALSGQDLPSGITYEVLVVDNDSSDGTKDIVASLNPQFSGALRYVFENRRSPASARNAGIREAKGECLVFTDDDCLPAPDWIKNIYEAHRTMDADAVQGRVVLDADISRFDWLSEDIVRRRFAHVDYGDKARAITEEDLVGANMSVRADVFKRFGLFRTEKIFRYCEDTEFSRRVSAGGIRKVYAPRALVYHRFRTDRIKPGKLLRQTYWWARASVLLEPEDIPWHRHLRYCCKELLRNLPPLLRAVLSADVTRKFRCRAKIMGYWGRCVQIVISRLGRGPDLLKTKTGICG